MMGGTIKCPICGKPYQWFSYYAGDQSACPACRRKAARGLGIPGGSRWQEQR